MKRKRHLIITFQLIICFILIFPIENFAQSQDIFKNHEHFSGRFNSGACYQKAYFDDITLHYEVQYPVYYGEELPENNPNLSYETIFIEGLEYWEEIRQCDNCIFYCKVKLEPEEMEIIVVNDTSLCKEFVIETFDMEKVVEKGTLPEWKQVVCPDLIDEEFISELQSNLSMLGYYHGEISGTIDFITEKALENFQDDHDLAKGGFFLDTMDLIDVLK